MPRFRYEARTLKGETKTGLIEAETKSAAAAALRAQGFFVIKMVPERAARESAPGRLVSAIWDPIFFRVKLRDMALLFRELHHCLDAGMTPYHAVKTVSERMRNRRLRYVLTEMTDELARGEPLSAQMGRFPTIFSEIMRNMVLAGERSGDLAGMLGQLAEYLDYEYELRRKFSLQTFYPKLLIVAILLIPSAITWATGGFSAWLSEMFSYARIAGLLLAAWVAFRIALHSEPFARLWDRIKLAIPLVGTTVRRFACARFSRSFATLYRAGLPMDTSVELSARACGNRYIRDRCLEMIPAIMEGTPVADALAQTGQFPHHVIEMVHTGQVTGDLDTLLNKVADFMEAEADAAANRMAVAILPVSVLILGVVVFFKVLAFYQGYFSNLLNSY